MVRKSDRKQDEKSNDPRWDRKQGIPKSSNMARVVEQSSGRYSASEQSEERKTGVRRRRRG